MNAITPRSSDPCRLVEWKPLASGALLGKATIAFTGGWIVAGIPIFRRADGSLSAGGPDTPVVGSDGVQLRDGEGRRRYAKVISFETSEARERWNRAVLDALRVAGIGGAP